MESPSEAQSQSLKESPLATQLQSSTESDWIVVESVDELVEKSPVIVIGEVIQPVAVINMARDINDIRKPDPTIFMLGQVYEIAVESYLQGDGPLTLQVVQREGFVYARDGEALDQNFSADEISMIKQASLRNHEHVPLHLGGRYVFFLGDLDSGFEKAEYFTGVAGIPWRLAVSESGELIPESPSAEANEVLRGITLTELEKTIQRELNAE